MGKDTEGQAHPSDVAPGQYPLEARTSAGVFTVSVSEPNPPSLGSLYLLNAAQRSWHSDLIP